MNPTINLHKKEHLFLNKSLIQIKSDGYIQSIYIIQYNGYNRIYLVIFTTVMYVHIIEITNKWLNQPLWTWNSASKKTLKNYNGNIYLTIND